MNFAIEADGVDPGPVREPLQTLYDALDADVASAGPSCALSGRCCRFEEYGHTLFVSAAEFAVLLADAPEPSRPLDDGATCPWQDRAGRCSARGARPLGCRLYYCDPEYQDRCRELGEAYVERLRGVVDGLGLPWDYAPLHRHLRTAVERGAFPAPAGETSAIE